MQKTLAEKFGLKVRSLRQERGWSQEEFAHLSGLDRTYVSGIERGVRNPTLEIIGQIARGFDLRLSELLDGVEAINRL